MPELPQVEALRGWLDAQLAGHAIAGVQLTDFSALKTYQPPLAALIGLEINGVGRHGKMIDIDAQGEHLIVHFSRAGWLKWKPEQPAAPARPGKGPLSFRLTLDDGSGFDLTEAGTQRKLAIWVADDPASIEQIASLGPDPLSSEFTFGVFDQIMDDAGRSQIKGVLRDQHRIAGIGNAYSDEILYAAKLSPFMPASNLDGQGRRMLYDQINAVLAEALDRCQGLPPDKLKDDKRQAMKVHGRAGERCEICGSTIAQVNFADSSLQYCPGCQTGGKVLADRRMSKLLR
ncbi:DNA-formamidopyrimidine glycosylase family protein [Propionimicrobium sp. PCR01-08-3]|uniref:DNA-formamidopyrimidine glycosylase family protein n=1 Tax=Propionimicrobium sp. PCR01-08-3 TaxID=3052086 RepID=UPI00255C5405|nr:DNA-formamidopyrimidine glycosylase family protein [Propionimicrobium sp. PCR01-08-3]WIY82712.1 DNA-formamidopyrimidine glycosylase family protein [Propionimicrobium sp. PCR01-08-3]